MGKSPCCGAQVRLFGGRRRQCRSCLRTWRVWRRKRGRRSLRGADRLLQRVFLSRRSLTEIARSQGRTKQALSYRFLRSLERHLKRPHRHKLPESENLVMLGDGLWFRFNRRPWVLYLIALKRCDQNEAIFLPPVLQAGSESKGRWQKAIDLIPQKQRRQIRAAVFDDFAGCTTLATENGWILQLCQFHLIAALRSRVGYRRPRTIGAHSIRLEAYQLVKIALSTADEGVLDVAVNAISGLIRGGELPVSFLEKLREFLWRLPQYRAYRLHPALRLPKTTSSIESMCRVIRDLMRHNRSLRTPKALNLWARGLHQFKHRIVCNSA